MSKLATIDKSAIRQMTYDDLEMVLAWRNHPEVRRYMYTQHEISLEEHTQWFEQTTYDDGKHLLIFEYQDISCGFVSFSEVENSDITEWGFYTSPEAPKGTGRLLGELALFYAFAKAGFHKVHGKVIDSNKRSANFHLNQGFNEEGVLRNNYFDGAEYHDVICFGITKYDWQGMHKSVAVEPK